MMDRRLKERLVGATILVALIVLIVPEMLSGPKRPSVAPLAAGLHVPTRSVWVDLATSKASAGPEGGEAAPPSAAAAPPAAPGPSDAPPSSSAGSVSPGPSIEPAPASAPSIATLKAQTAAQPPLETPPSAPKSQPTASRPAALAEPAAATRHAWAVQLGSFASKANAERLMRRLQASGGTFYILPGGSGRSLRYRVRMGPLADRSAAERAVAKLKTQGHAATIVTPVS